MRPLLERPEIRRGEPWQPGPPVSIDPNHLEPGLSVLVTTGPSAWLPEGVYVVYLAHLPGRAVVGVPMDGGAMEAVLVDPGRLAVYVPDPDVCCLDWEDYREGFDLGHWESTHDRPISTQVQGGVPSWFGRGVCDGYAAGKANDHDWDAPLRYLKARLARTHPDEWPYRYLRVAREAA